MLPTVKVRDGGGRPQAPRPLGENSGGSGKGSAEEVESELDEEEAREERLDLWRR
jgi:hypothetical protein